MLGDGVGSTSAVLIIGAPGAGKSSTLEALSDLLTDADVPHSVLEVEHLGWGHPWLGMADTLTVLDAALHAQIELGRDMFVLSATPENDEELDAVRAALPFDRVIVVALRVRPETAAARVLGREPPHWSGRERLAEHARELATRIPRLAGVDVVLDSERHEPISVARAIYDEARA
jgi:chloramphenicol 3-O-phosphotransferase